MRNKRPKSAPNQPAFSADALAKFSSLEPVDTHSHVFQTGPTFVAMLDRLHMHLMDIIDVGRHHSLSNFV